MYLKTIILSVLALSAFCATYAQDKIYKRDGEIIEAKVKEVSPQSITYKRFDNQDGPEYSINKNDVEKIKYQNGTVDEFEDRADKRRYPGAPFARSPRSEKNSHIQYNKNIIAIAPLQLTENGIGFSLSYERELDKRGILSFYIPAMLTFDINNSSTNVNYPYNSNQSVNADPMFYVMPGIKFYPTGSHGKVKYSVGPALVIADGKHTDYTYDLNGNYTQVQEDHFIFGAIVNNSLNINPTAHLNLGLDFGLGGSYVNKLNGVNQGITTLTQFSFKIGYRF